MLEETAWELLELAAGPVMLWPLCLPPSNVHMPLSKPNIESDLLQKIPTRLLLLTEARSRSPGWFRQHMAEREAKVLVKDLKEHLPGLWKQDMGATSNKKTKELQRTDQVPKGDTRGSKGWGDNSRLV